MKTPWQEYSGVERSHLSAPDHGYKNSRYKTQVTGYPKLLPGQRKPFQNKQGISGSDSLAETATTKKIWKHSHEGHY